MKRLLREKRVERSRGEKIKRATHTQKCTSAAKSKKEIGKRMIGKRRNCKEVAAGKRRERKIVAWYTTCLLL
jgi:hypothetical protein